MSGQNRNYGMLFGILSALSFLYTVPILLADRYYRDDLSRALTGATGWIRDGRPLTEFIIRILDFGRPAADLFPLPLFLSVLCFSAAMTCYVRQNLSEFRLSLPLCAACFPVIANPCFIPNLSYRYDCLPMVLSVCLPFLAFSLPEQRKRAVEFLIQFLSVLAVYCLFQPSVGIYFSLIFLELFLMICHREKEDRKRYLLRSGIRLAALAAGTLFYLSAVSPMFVDSKGWRKEASEIGLSPAVLWKNLKKIYPVLRRNSILLPKTFLLPAALMVLISLTGLGIRLAGNVESGKRTEKACAFCLPFCMPGILLFTGILPLTALQSLPVSEHVLTGICVCLFYLGIAMTYTAQYGIRGEPVRAARRIRRLLLPLLILCLLFPYSYMYAYGSAMRSQKTYETYVAETIARDIEEVDPEGERKWISISGRMRKSRAMQTAAQKYPAFHYIIPVYLYNEDWIGAAFLYHFLQRDLSVSKLTEEDRDLIRNTEPAVSHGLYKLYAGSGKLILVFPE